MSTIRQSIRNAIRSIKNSEYAWLLTTKGRKLLRECYQLGLEGKYIPPEYYFYLPAHIANQIGVSERRWKNENISR